MDGKKGVKACTRCKADKPLDGFPWSGRGTRRPVCRVCTNADRARHKVLHVKPKSTKQAVLDAKKEYYRRRRAIEKLRSGKFVGDGPCWVCRNQAVGETPYRLCIVCLG